MSAIRLDLGAGAVSPPGYPAIVGSHDVGRLPTERGIYAIMLWPRSRFYVGSSNNILARCRDHRSRLRNGSHHNRLLQEAWSNSGERAFLWMALRPVPEAADLLGAEKKGIDLLRGFEPFGGFNLEGDPVSGSLSESARDKLKRSLATFHWARGKTLAPEVCAKYSASVRQRGPGSGQFKGVHRDPRTGTFMARIYVARRQVFLGRYATEVEAAQAYNIAASEHFGPGCYLNPVPEGLPARRTALGRPAREGAHV